MAARSSRKRDTAPAASEDVEVVDVGEVEVEDEQDAFADPEEQFDADDLEADLDDDEIQSSTGEDVEGGEQLVSEVPEEGTTDPDEEAPATAVTMPAGVEFDEDDEELAQVVAADDDDLDEGIEGLRDGEFVCRSCFMAKRETQLADPERMLCRDCA